MSIQPIRDRVLVKPIENSKTSSGGIIIPDVAKEASSQGTVISVGGGRITEDGTIVPLVVKEGDTVIFAKNSGSQFKVNGEEYLVLKEDEVIAIIN